MLRRFFPLLLVFGLGLGLGGILGALAFRAYIGSFTFDDLSGTGDGGLDHGLFQGLLNRHLQTDAPDGIHRFDYRAAQTDRPILDAYVATLEATDPASLSRDEALAYWLNLYNAGMIQLVLERGVYDSVIDNRVYFFLTDHFEVAGTRLSLDKIENQIIRVQWDEPRIHYGLNCASLSCPNLAATPFNGAELDAQLNAAARAYINHPRGVAGVRGSRLVVSEIYQWFASDFGGDDASLIAHLRQYASAPLADQLTPDLRVSTQPYDWTLNMTTP